MVPALSTRGALRRQTQSGGQLTPATRARNAVNESSPTMATSLDEDKLSLRTREIKRKTRESSRESHTNADDDHEDDGDGAIIFDATLLIDDDHPTPKRRNKGKEREHTPDEDDNITEDGQNVDEALDQESQSQETPEDDTDEENAGENGPAPVPHWQIWDRLVRQASHNGAFAYIHEPEHGSDPMDVTAYKPLSATWGNHRTARPPIVSLWMPPEPLNNPTYTLGVLHYRGQVIQDWKGRDIRAFRNLPLTISSAVSGMRLEAWLRSDNRIKYRDIVARMRTKDGPQGRTPIIGDRALASRCSNFRAHAGCVCWTVLENQRLPREYMDNLRTPAQKANNLTTDRDLTMNQLRDFLMLTRTRLPGTKMATNIPPGLSMTSAKAQRIVANASEHEPPKRSMTLRSAGRKRAAPGTSRPSNYAEIAPASEHSGDNENEDEIDTESSQVQQLADTEIPSNANNHMEEDHETMSSGVPASEPEDTADARNDVPTSVVEAEILQLALEQTIADFVELTNGCEPVQARPEENYLSQWYAYQSQFEIIWRQLGNTGKPPVLRGLDKWSGGIANWEAAYLAPTDRTLAEELSISESTIEE